MGDDAPAAPAGPATGGGATGNNGVTTHAERRHSTASTENNEKRPDIDQVPLEDRNLKPPFSRAQTSVDVADYFVGPRNLEKHSKWPIFLRLHGSIMPEMVLPLLFVAGWATAIRLISHYVHPLGVDTVLLTVLGFVVGLGLSFRSSTAYERYNDGRKYWAQLSLTSQNLARVIWIHGIERPATAKEDLLGKMTALNLIIAFAIALKHKLRFEPYTMYDDLHGFVGHLDTFAHEATDDKSPVKKKPGFFKAMGEYLGVSFAESNPLKLVKQSEKPLGNLPLEILNHLAAYCDELVEGGQLKVPMQQTLAYNNIASLNDVLTGTDRILTTPLPLAYSISIAQITWVYIIMLPFQLESRLKWIAIPASVIASYIILGLLLIGREIENPFAFDVNDLPLDAYCQQIAADVDTISSRKKPNMMQDVIKHAHNKVMFPLSNLPYSAWADRSERVIREELKFKAQVVMLSKWRNLEQGKTMAEKSNENHGQDSKAASTV